MYTHREKLSSIKWHWNNIETELHGKQWKAFISVESTSIQSLDSTEIYETVSASCFSKFSSECKECYLLPLFYSFCLHYIALALSQMDCSIYKMLPQNGESKLSSSSIIHCSLRKCRKFSLQRIISILFDNWKTSIGLKHFDSFWKLL